MKHPTVRVSPAKPMSRMRMSVKLLARAEHFSGDVDAEQCRGRTGRQVVGAESHEADELEGLAPLAGDHADLIADDIARVAGRVGVDDDLVGPLRTAPLDDGVGVQPVVGGPVRADRPFGEA